MLETTCARPSGVSYMLEDRKMMMRLSPELFAGTKVAPVQHYPDMLLEKLRAVAPKGDDPTVVVLTPGPIKRLFRTYLLAQQMGVGAGRGPRPLRQDGGLCAPRRAAAG